jgi:hypothetical protein
MEGHRVERITCDSSKHFLYQTYDVSVRHMSDGSREVIVHGGSGESRTEITSDGTIGYTTDSAGITPKILRDRVTLVQEMLNSGLLDRYNTDKHGQYEMGL